MSLRGLRVAAVIALLGVLGVRVARAQSQGPEAVASAPLRAVLWLPAGANEVVDRIVGQTNDLNVELLVNTLDPIPREPGAQWRAVDSLSTNYSASLVIWFDPEQPFVLNIAVPKTQRLLTRDLGPSGQGLSEAELASVVKESAALVVRAAIQAVMSGMTIGDVHTPVNTAEVSSAPSAPPASTVPPAPKAGPWRDATRQRNDDIPPKAAQRTNAWALGVDWRWIYDSPKGSPLAGCASANASRRQGSLLAAARVGACLNRDIDSRPDYAFGQFRIGRQDATLGAQYVVWEGAAEARVGAHVGGVLYERSTVNPSPLGVTPKSASLHALGVLGPEFRLLIPGKGSPLHAGLELGLDFLTNSLQIGYQTQSGFVPVAKTSAIQPYGALGLTLEL